MFVHAKEGQIYDGVTRRKHYPRIMHPVSLGTTVGIYSTDLIRDKHFTHMSTFYMATEQVSSTMMNRARHGQGSNQRHLKAAHRLLANSTLPATSVWPWVTGNHCW